VIHSSQRSATASTSGLFASGRAARNAAAACTAPRRIAAWVYFVANRERRWYVPAGFPSWGAAEDFNIQDAPAAEAILREGNLTLVPLNLTVQTAVRRTHLPTLQRTGPLGALLARQIAAQAHEEQAEERWGRRYSRLTRRYARLFS
jgi:hypothetical protein